MAKQEPTVATESSTWGTMQRRWHLIESLLGGTEAMREMGEIYLPRFPEENQEEYRMRLERTVLLNMTEMVLEALVGRVFREPPKLGDDVPDQIATLVENVDLQGNHLNVFAREWFREGVAKGMSHVLVDFQQPEATDDPQAVTAAAVVATLADDREKGLRPYWMRVRPENLIAAYSTTVNGREVLTHVRIRENSVERQGFGEVFVERIRVIEPTHWQVWRNVGEQRDKEKWIVESEGVNAFGAIPLVTFYTGRQGFMLSKPPLTDLANLNIAHWQSSSDQRNVLTVARFPILAVSGASADDTAGLRIGPNQWLATPDPAGKWYYVEHGGKAIEAGQKDLESLESQMGNYGAEFLKEKSGTQTATARALDSSEATSALAAMAMDFQDALEQALQLTATWLKLPSGGSVEVSCQDDADEAEQTVMDALFKARAARDVSRRTYLQVLVSRGVLPEDFDADDDLALLNEEIELGMPAGGMDPSEPNGKANKDQTAPAAPGATGAGGGSDRVTDKSKAPKDRSNNTNTDRNLL